MLPQPYVLCRFDPGDLRDHARSFIVFTSNVFAIMGLRSLYFPLAGVIDKFVHNAITHAH